MEDEISTSPDTSTEIEPFQHAPTLLAGSTAGSGGKVKVWAPTAREIWIATRSQASFFAKCLCLLAAWDLFRHHTGGIEIGYFIILFGLLLTALMTRLTMPYVTTDDSGIGLTTLDGTRAFRWNEIRSVESTWDWLHPLLRFDVGQQKPVTCNMLGHSHEAQQDLLKLIVEQAHLEPESSKPSKFVRHSRAVTSWATWPPLPPADSD